MTTTIKCRLGRPQIVCLGYLLEQSQALRHYGIQSLINLKINFYLGKSNNTFFGGGGVGGSTLIKACLSNLPVCYMLLVRMLKAVIERFDQL